MLRKSVCCIRAVSVLYPSSIQKHAITRFYAVSFCACNAPTSPPCRCWAKCLAVGAMLAPRLAKWVGPVDTSLLARPKALGAAGTVLCLGTGACAMSTTV